MIFDRREAARREARMAALRRDMEELQARRRTLAELQTGLAEEQALLTKAIATLRPGGSWEETGDLVRQICFRPLELSSFFLAQVDWREGWLHFPFFFEVSRARQEPSRRLADQPGLTGRALELGHALYLASKEETFGAGAVLTDAEKSTGLLSQSWFGVPLAGREPERPAGLMGFQSFQAHAFPEGRRRLMSALAAITALHLP